MILPDQIERAGAAIDQFVDYFEQLIAKRRAAPKNDLLSAMIAAEEQGDKLTDPAVVDHILRHIAAGGGSDPFEARAPPPP